MSDALHYLALKIQALLDAVEDPKNLMSEIEDVVGELSDPTAIIQVIPCTTGDRAWHVGEGGIVDNRSVVAWGLTRSDQMVPMTRQGGCVQVDWSAFWVSPKAPPDDRLMVARKSRLEDKERAEQ
jgi:hypothetical protein